MSRIDNNRARYSLFPSFALLLNNLCISIKIREMLLELVERYRCYVYEEQKVI